MMMFFLHFERRVKYYVQIIVSTLSSQYGSIVPFCYSFKADIITSISLVKGFEDGMYLHIH